MLNVRLSRPETCSTIDVLLDTNVKHLTLNDLEDYFQYVMRGWKVFSFYEVQPEIYVVDFLIGEQCHKINVEAYSEDHAESVFRSMYNNIISDISLKEKV